MSTTKISAGTNPSYTPMRSFKQVKPGVTSNKRIKKTRKIPESVKEQQELCQLYNYKYRVASNGNVENNTTLYVNTGVAHASQVKTIFTDVVERAKAMPEVFGHDFECNVEINLVRRHNGEYVGYAFVDLSNPKLYYALIGFNVDGTDRVEYVEDKNWKPPTSTVPKTSNTTPSKLDWAEDDDTISLPPPKIKQQLEPLITLSQYKLDEEQKKHIEDEETDYGSIIVSPSFIMPGVEEGFDECSLYVSDVPEVNYDFLYKIFSRYARTPSTKKDFYPIITIKKNHREGRQNIYAIVQYSHPYDASFALQMLQKIRAKYNDEQITMSVRHAFMQKGNYNRKKIWQNDEREEVEPWW